MRVDAQGRGVVNIAGGRQADAGAPAVRDLPAVAAGRTLRKAARGGRPGSTHAWCSSSTRRICCSRMLRRRCWTKIEQVVRLVRSKGVGVYFVTQNPLDIPETVLGQLGNRIQHALRAFTPRDQKARHGRPRRPCAPILNWTWKQAITGTGRGRSVDFPVGWQGAPGRDRNAPGSCRPPAASGRPHRRSAMRCAQSSPVTGQIRAGDRPGIGLRGAGRPRRRSRRTRDRPPARGRTLPAPRGAARRRHAAGGLMGGRERCAVRLHRPARRTPRRRRPDDGQDRDAFRRARTGARCPGLAAGFAAPLARGAGIRPPRNA